MTDKSAALELIAAIRGGIPSCCEFCGGDYTDYRHPVPEEAGAWACNVCIERWEKEEQNAD